jgi:hypothetical protein
MRDDPHEFCAEAIPRESFNLTVLGEGMQPARGASESDELLQDRHHH